jgi:hypothetical protein
VVPGILRISGHVGPGARVYRRRALNVIESAVVRKLSTWTLLIAFSLANLPPLGIRAASRGGGSCCSSASCCRNGHCSMNGSRAGVPGMPLNCAVHKASPIRQRAASCTCWASHAPSIAAAPAHSYFYVDPSERRLIFPLPATGWLTFPPGLSTLPGFPPSASHPPKLRS